MPLSRHDLLTGCAGFLGAAGVAAGAAGAHGGGGHLATASVFLLIHAAALLALGLTQRCHTAGVILLAGTVLFCGDLVFRDLTGGRLFPMAAPAGGLLLMAGWVAIPCQLIIQGIMKRL